VQAPTVDNPTDVGLGDSIFFWDPNFLMQDMLPATLFDTSWSLPCIETRHNNQLPQSSSLSHFSSRLPLPGATEDGFQDEAENGDQSHPSAESWFVTDSAYEGICVSIKSYSGVLPAECPVPSRNNLARYLETYFKCAQQFLPFIHTATFSVEQSEVELLLAVAAHGSLYRFEFNEAYALYLMTKAIVFEKRRRDDLQLASGLLTGQSLSPSNALNELWNLQTIILLVSFASWADKKIVPDAFSMGSPLAMLVRENGISESDEML
jgi:hypothetical protein